MFENSSPTRSLTVAAPYEQCRGRNRGRQGADRRRNLRSFFIAALISIPLLAADVNPDQYLAHVRYLASPELKGRATGSPGLEKAAHYIAGQFRSFGLKPEE